MISRRRKGDIMVWVEGGFGGGPKRERSSSEPALLLCFALMLPPSPPEKVSKCLKADAYGQNEPRNDTFLGTRLQPLTLNLSSAKASHITFLVQARAEKYRVKSEVRLRIGTIGLFYLQGFSFDTVAHIRRMERKTVVDTARKRRNQKQEDMKYVTVQVSG